MPQVMRTTKADYYKTLKFHKKWHKFVELTLTKINGFVPDNNLRYDWIQNKTLWQFDEIICKKKQQKMGKKFYSKIIISFLVS